MLSDMSQGQSCSVLANLIFPKKKSLPKVDVTGFFSEITSRFIGLSPYATILLFTVHNFHASVVDAH